MGRIIIKNKKVYISEISQKSGMALLYSVVISSIILSIALGVSNIAFREINFSTSMKEGNDAFYAADTAVECVLHLDSSVESQNPFTGTCVSNPLCPIRCNNTNFGIGWNAITDPDYVIFTMKMTGLGISGQSCAVATLRKPKTDPTLGSQITSIGYNIHDGSLNCNPVSTSVERMLEVNY